MIFDQHPGYPGWVYLEVLDQALDGFVMDVGLHGGLVAGQRVVIVEAIDVNVAQIQLRIGKHRRRVHVRRKFLGWNENGENDKEINTWEKII